MSLSPPGDLLPAPESDQTSLPSASWPLVIVALIGGLAISLVAGTHVALALVILPIVVAVAFVSPQSLILLLVIWLLELGLVRRLIPGGSLSGISGDPLLMIGPAVIFALFMRAVSAGAMRNRTGLASVVLGFNIIAILQAANPGQGSLMSGLGGLLFLLVPMLAFWVGRSLMTEQLFRQIRWTVAILGFLNACYGISQQFSGFQSWDAKWVQTQGYTALNVGNGVVRAFGSSSSAQEYAVTLAIGIVAWISLISEVRPAIRIFMLAPVVPMVLALYWESQRSALLLAIFGLGLMIGTRFKMRARWVAVAGVLAVFMLVFGARAIGSGGPAQAGDAASTLSNHQIAGLADPTGSKSSYNSHMNRTVKGITQGFTNPLGSGTGSVTLAGSKYSTVSKGTEMDPGNMAIAFGLPGVILYALGLILASQKVYRRGIEGHHAAVFATGVLGAALFQWFNGDLYGVCSLIWLSLGYVDQLPEAAQPEPVELLAPVLPRLRGSIANLPA